MGSSKQYTSNKVEITNTKVDAMLKPQLTPRKNKRAKPNVNILRDSKLTGFYIKMTPSGHKTWFYYYRTQISQIERNYHIGTYPEMQTKAARKEAFKIAGLVAQGKDPHLDRRTKIKEGTFAEYSAIYCKALPKKKSRKQEIDTHNKYLMPHLAKMKIGDIMPVDIEMVRNAYESTPSQANRAKVYIHKFFVWAMKNKYVLTNPAANIPQLPMRKRQFHMSDTLFAKLSAELTKHEKEYPVESYFIGLLVATGCRPEELFRRPWVDLDFESSQLFNIPSKTGHITKQLSPNAIDLFKRLAKHTGHSKWMFPSPMYPDKHRVSFRSFWYKIRDAIGLTTDDQMRDLRHHFATHLLNNDTDIATVSALMNHKSIKTTADHYAQVLGQTKQKALAKASKGLKLF